MKRRQRRPVLDINNEQSDSPRGRWQNKYQQIAVDHPERNGNSNNPLASLLGQYNSDSESEDTKQECNKLNDKVNDFLKEIQMIAPDAAKINDTTKTTESMNSAQHSSHPGPNETSSCSWQECFDESTGYPYYWNIETNEVTWEMPSELRLNKEKCGQDNQNQMQVHHVHSAHAQVQWTNFLPNTYPELQTNIPEGMIPKEVVARNRNRQVGITRSQQEVEHTAQIPKKTRPSDYDSDDEKIEMITSFGNDESESDMSDNDSPVKKTLTDKATVQKVKKSNANLVNDKNLVASDENSLAIGPALPMGIIPMVHGPENVSMDTINVDNHENTTKTEIRDSNKNTVDKIKDVNIDSKENAKSDDIDEQDILKRLKNQAELLQSLGGEVPESVETLINNNVHEKNKEEEEDIISQIEKEMPVDHARNVDSFTKLEIERIKSSNSSVNKIQDKNKKEIKISLVAGYSDDSDVEDETSPKKLTNSQPLFPIISEYVANENSNNSLLKVSGDSNLAKDIYADNGGIKGFETKPVDIDAAKLSNYIEEYGEKVHNESKEALNENIGQPEINRSGTAETGETKAVKSDIESTRQHSFLENLEMPAKGFQRKKRIAFDVIPNKISRPQSEALNNQASKVEPSSLNFLTSTTPFDNSERHGFGFHEDSEKQTDETCNTSGDVNKDKIISEKQRDASQLKKSISFVKGETTLNFVKTEEKPNPKDNKELKELTEIVMEKIKFLSEGSQNLSAIQIMVIQLQTLVGAWEAGDLKENYLYEWLKGTGHELARLEKAAAPPGWDCHWDRSHKRYYYRNSTTGEAQWTYPEADVVGGTEEMDLCTTPPPEDGELHIIEEGNESMQKPKPDTMPLMITGNNKIIQITKDEYKSMEAPPPPQISSPSPPPPPRIFAEDMKKGKKRPGSGNERNLDSKKEKIEGANSSSDYQEGVDPPLPPSPPKNTSQPPLPPNPPHAAINPNTSNSEPLPPGVDPKDMPYPLPAVTTMEPGVIYTGSTQQTNPIYAATIGDRGITVPIIDHHSAIIQGQLMHYPTYQHLHNQAMIAAAGSLAGQEAVQFMITDYAQIYANTQVIAKPPVKSQSESLGSALDSFYNDIASIEKTNADQESTIQQDLETPCKETTTPPPTTLPTPIATVNSLTEVEQLNTSVDVTAKEKKKKKTKIGIGKKQKEMSTMVAKWQRAQQDFDDSE